MTTTTKPRWVECADEAAKVLGMARNAATAEDRDSIVREAGMWANLACVYRYGKERKLDA